MAIVIPGKPTYKSIKLQTRLENDIDNNQDFDFSLSENIPDYSEDYPAAIPRNAPNPFYNCYGMTFACARTMIDPESITMIMGKYHIQG
jgi:murein tripeptide amidase MpaA